MTTATTLSAMTEIPQPLPTYPTNQAYRDYLAEIEARHLARVLALVFEAMARPSR